jgi:hypothetical protein
MLDFLTCPALVLSTETVGSANMILSQRLHDVIQITRADPSRGAGVEPPPLFTNYHFKPFKADAYNATDELDPCSIVNWRFFEPLEGGYDSNLPIKWHLLESFEVDVRDTSGHESSFLNERPEI